MGNRFCCKRHWLRKPASAEEKILRRTLANKKLCAETTAKCWEPFKQAGYLRECDIRSFLDVIAETVGSPALGSRAYNATDATMLFARYDTDHDGRLGTQEATELVKSLLLKRCKDLSGEGELDIPKKWLREHYRVLKKLGEGGQGAMYLARHIATDQTRCLKLYQKGNKNAPLEDIKAEFQLMKRFNSPYVARTYEIFQEWNYVFIASEPYTGNDLCSLVANASQAGVSVDESWLSEVFVQILKGLVYMHQFGVIHGDLKEANVMVAADSHWERPHIVLIDFGLAQHFLSTERFCSGTPGYIPAEVLENGLWTHKGDIFSAGVTFFSIVSGGCNPFITHSLSGKSEDVFWREMKTRVCNLRPSFEHLPSKTTTAFKDLLARMLSRNFRERPTASACIQDAWFTKRVQNEETLPTDIVNRLRSVHRRGVAQQAIAEHMLANCNLAHLRDLNDCFRRLDVDGDGTVSIKEARQGLARISTMSEVDINNFVEVLTGQDGNVDYLQFMAQMIDKEYRFEEGMLADLFHKVDINGDGYISQEELPMLMEACRYDPNLTEQLMREMDANGDRKISFEEFKQACIGKGSLEVKRSHSFDNPEVVKRRRLTDSR